MRMAIVRILVVLSVVLGLVYLSWRWSASLNWAAWWIAVPLVLAETYSFLDVAFFGATVWRLKNRGEPPAPPRGLEVDVFITTYNEPIDLVLRTAAAARDIAYPHRTWILDDGARPPLEAEAERLGVGYITRGAEWAGRPRHAKAGNVNNALLRTTGEFVLILDADQVPEPQILDRTLGYFNDRRMALVQTPQVFWNVAKGDPLGSQAPLFYGPIQQGKDGWNAAFFCGSNAVLRREALMQLGLAGYVQETVRNVRRALRASGTVLARARRRPEGKDPAVRGLLNEVEHALRGARRRLRAGDPLADVTFDVRERVRVASADLASRDTHLLPSDVQGSATLSRDLPGGYDDDDLSTAMIHMGHHEWSPLGALESVNELLDAVSVVRPGEALPVMALATNSVTEDMATSMRLHAAGWRSAYHHETLAYGLAPEDLGSMLTQRLRWAQGSVQVALRDNPLTMKGLGLGQKLMYFATMFSYLNGYAAVVYIAAPVIYMLLGILPVFGLTADFFVRFIPFIIVNQLLFLVVGWGIPTWRGQQYSLALFPVWIEACSTAIRNVWFARPLGFAVTPKVRTAQDRTEWRRIAPQLWAMGLLAGSCAIALLRLAVLQAGDPLGTLVNSVWVVYDLAALGIVIRAARYRGSSVERIKDAVRA